MSLENDQKKLKQFRTPVKRNRLPEPQNVNTLHPTGDYPEDGMDKIVIRGGHRLEGEVTISGAKNAVLPLMCAAILTEDPIKLSNAPVTLRDIDSLCEVLKFLGVAIAIDDVEKSIELCGDAIDNTTAEYNLVRKMRASVLVLGPLLARFGEARVSLPGGCAIGSRPVDLHIKGLEAMGANIGVEDGYIVATASNGRLNGATFEFPVVSVGATENVLMAAVLADGVTVLKNAAREPEITDLAECLNKMGAKISGIGTSTLLIEGVERLHGTAHNVVPDRIEAGTFMIATAMTGGDVILKNAVVAHLEPLVKEITKCGVEINVLENGDIHVSGGVMRTEDEIYVETQPYPGFPTDLQAQLMAMFAFGNIGNATIKETVFENRFMHVPELNRMGARITNTKDTAVVKAVATLKGAPVMATDLRASVALVLAGLVAKGETVISRIYHLERGYESISEKLGALGADIRKISG